MMSPGLAALTAPWIVSQLRSAVVHVFVLSPGTFQVGAVGIVQTPPWQASLTVHGLPSLHAVPSFAAGFEQVPVPGSQVPATWHWSLAVQTTGFCPMQTPPIQTSVGVH